MPPPEPTSLAELQHRFAAALSGSVDADASAADDFASCVVGDGLAPAARAQVYCNNVRAMFEGALERTYPVLRRQIGPERFRTLARSYRSTHPSRSGDLHWVGRAFPDWLAAELAGGEQAWLADLARLEWACEEALVAEQRPPVDCAALAGLAVDAVIEARFELQPSVRVVSSAFPVWTVWRESQPGAPGELVDPAPGAQCIVVVCTADGLVLHSLPAERCRFVAALVSGASLGEALDTSGLEVEQMPAALGWLFGEGLVTAVHVTGRGERG